MQARVFHIHEAPVTLCPLIYKAQCSAESVPPDPQSNLMVLEQ